ncbi:MAG: sugar kinase [Alphaproteobacteria bacterium]|nr:MAG: sugar kinase [Alphaproteobacteria bacterium]
MASVLCVGHAVQDFVFAVDALPAGGEKYRAHGFDSMGGGPAATAAVTIARLDGAAFLAARLGDDSIADLIVAELQSHGVDTQHMRRFAGCRSSLSAVMLDKAGERMIVNYLDPAMPTDAAWLPPPGTLGVAAVLADTRWPAGAAAALTLAKAAGLPAVLDADRPLGPNSPLLAAASHIAFSAEGLADYAGHRDMARALADVAAATGAWTCVTMGGEGVLVQQGTARAHVPAFRVQVVDTLGAGDVWHGAFALALAEGERELPAVRFANAAAALKAQRLGGRRGVPTRGELTAFLSQHTQHTECGETA